MLYKWVRRKNIIFGGKAPSLCGTFAFEDEKGGYGASRWIRTVVVAVHPRRPEGLNQGGRGLGTGVATCLPRGKVADLLAFRDLGPPGDNLGQRGSFYRALSPPETTRQQVTLATPSPAPSRLLGDEHYLRGEYSARFATPPNTV